jgi:hypothetical protein
MRVKVRPHLLSELTGHFAMGVALGLACALVLAAVDDYGVRELILRSDNPRSVLWMFVGTFVLMFGIGATLTGLVLTIMEDNDPERR